MGLLKFFSTEAQPPAVPTRLPSGSFTIDAAGRVLTSTLPRSFPEHVTEEIGQEVLAAFRSGQQAGLSLSELVIHFCALRITARELRGGAIVFLSPQSFHRPSP
jgi:hypothetical protein